jgi:hypothetical protein
MIDSLKVGGVFQVTCYRKDGSIRWQDTAKNIVTTEGLNHILDVLFTGTGESQVDPWYVGLLAASPTPAAGDTLSGISEFTDYDEAARQAYVDVRSNQTVTNAASKASFTIDTNSSTIGGAFLASASSGTSGILLCDAAFDGGNKAADDDDTLQVTYQFSAADA